MIPIAALRASVKYLSFPLTMGIGTCTAAYLIGIGIHPLLASIATVVPATLVVALLERLFPWEAPSCQRDDRRKEVIADLCHLVVFLCVGPLLQGALVLLVVECNRVLGITSMEALWPRSWPLLVQALLALIVWDLGAYWWHRWTHTQSALWRFHAVHHGGDHLYWLNGARLHPLDLLGLYTCGFTLLGILQVPMPTVVLMQVVAAIHGVFMHANIDLRLGPLNYVFSGIERHRWHHSRLPKEGNNNYGDTLIIFDLLFGTHLLPESRDKPEQMGIDPTRPLPTSYLSQLLFPFRWKDRSSREPSGGMQ